ncbi:hypothetical protein Pmgp_01624 [Pelotomaculum propionicicum]|uniref:Heavy-metal chelation domain-containing protein n=2 Tax=Pelotomaculum propionicicum TaxID=258475 RepID=A0A4Y7RRN0_9FIRM|nr:DUF364 domain-containing protein [Pelotomaculum propionicicum]NLI14247.1 DUF364 domain-containing protein [Peptococcaceae bacterium]TEB11436.1 hypothetical protein Pmgp_01624 [Pelotomaculum propionicicum]
MPVGQLAKHIKSWNFFDAAIGLAAINSVINTPERIKQLSGIAASDHKQISVFDYFADMIKGKNVAVIGHFPGLEKLAESCQLSILDRLPKAGDYPDPACEYILPTQDFVFITASTLVNKTLPRLLELSRNAFTVLWGPSTPMTPVLFNYGIDMLYGTVVVAQQSTRQSVEEGGTRSTFEQVSAYKVSLETNKRVKIF